MACLGDENEAPFLGPVWESLQQGLHYIRLFLADYFGESCVWFTGLSLEVHGQL